METAGRVHEHGVEAAHAGGGDGVERHCGGVAPAADARDAQAVRPDPELLRRPGAERVRRREEHAPAFSLARQAVRELRDRRGLPHPVYAEDEHHRRRPRRARQPARIAARRRRRREDAGDRPLERRPELAVRDPGHLLENLLRRGNAEVGFQKDTLQHTFIVPPET